MPAIPFFKYTSLGNNFVIVDETGGSPLLTEAEKSAFAYCATNQAFGVGADNLLVIQKSTPQTLQTINTARGYWRQTPPASQADYVFRMFEPDGQEALCCGNGLMCIAHYFKERHDHDRAMILTEIPMALPNRLTIGTTGDHGESWVDMGDARRMPEALVNRAQVVALDDKIDLVKQFKVKFRANDLIDYTDEKEISFCGYLVFTGEPHLVVLPEAFFAPLELAKAIFMASYAGAKAQSRREKRINFSTWLVQQIGAYINRNYRQAFPAGININFARIDPHSGAVEYRCFERGIYKETLACGTGALAVAYVINRLKLLRSDSMIIQPHRCRWYKKDARITVTKTGNGWRLAGTPQPLFDGLYRFDETTVRPPRETLDLPPMMPDAVASEPVMNHLAS